MNFDLEDDQKMLAKTVADFAKKESPVERFRKLRDGDGAGWEKSTWKQMGELGWLAVPFPESVGGFGGSFVECALVLEQLGKTLVPEPYLASVVLGGMALLRAGDAKQHERFLTPMLEGDTSLALAVAERATRFDTSLANTTATQDGEGYVLEGEKIFVLNGHAADHIVVSAMLGDELALFVVDGDGEGVRRDTIRLIDGHRGARVRLEKARVDGDRRLQSAPAGEVLERVMDYAAAGAVAEGLGVAQTMLATTVEYLKTREQFGAKIGSFQALQHRAVDMFVEVELLRSISLEAMVRVDQDGPARTRSVSAAKHQLATGATFVSRQSIQLHGGIGVTDEADIGLFFKRMHTLTTVGGDEAFHAERFARATD